MTSHSTPGKKTKTERQKRLGNALRENLRKRKAQTQARKDSQKAEEDKSASSDDEQE